MPKPKLFSLKEIDPELHRLKSVQDGRLTKVLLATTSALGLSCWMTAKGLFDKTIEAGLATPEGMGTALMSAGAAGIVMSTATMLGMVVASEAARHQRLAILALAVSLLPFVAGISSYNAVLGNAGPPSLVYDMRDRAEAYVEYYHRTETDAARAQSAAQTLAPIETSTCFLANEELENGILTGSAGPGATSAAYFSACENIGEIIATLDETIARTEDRAAAAEALLAALQAIPNDTALSVFERQAAFRDAARELEALAAGSNAERVSARLGPQLDILEASIAGLGTSGGALGDRQAVANANLHNTLTTVRDTVRELVSADAAAPPEPPGALPHMGAAVTAYWHRNIPQILLAVLTDLIPGWFLGLLLVSRRTQEDRRRALQDRADRTSGPAR